MSDDAERWLTYRELGELLRCTPNAARMHAHRRRWPKRAANKVGDPARVLVPEDEVVRTRAMHDAAPFVAQPNGHDAAHVQGLVQAVEVLRDQLRIANQRIASLELGATAERQQWAEERRGLIAILTDQRRRPWWRRWFR
jgi:hypothetical protein